VSTFWSCFLIIHDVKKHKSFYVERTEKSSQAVTTALALYSYLFKSSQKNKDIARKSRMEADYDGLTGLKNDQSGDIKKCALIAITAVSVFFSISGCGGDIEPGNPIRVSSSSEASESWKIEPRKHP
jgi:hypothetical protein